MNLIFFRFENDTLIAEAKREYDLRKAANDQEVQTQKAISDLARALQGTVKKRHQQTILYNHSFRCKNQTASQK